MQSVTREANKRVNIKCGSFKCLKTLRGKSDRQWSQAARQSLAMLMAMVHVVLKGVTLTAYQSQNYESFIDKHMYIAP